MAEYYKIYRQSTVEIALFPPGVRCSHPSITFTLLFRPKSTKRLPFIYSLVPPVVSCLPSISLGVLKIFVRSLLFYTS